MASYSTIPVRREVKKLLEKDKGSRDWSDYLMELYREARVNRAKLSLKELSMMLNEEELDAIEKEAREFRRRFTLG